MTGSPTSQGSMKADPFCACICRTFEPDRLWCPLYAHMCLNTHVYLHMFGSKRNYFHSVDGKSKPYILGCGLENVFVCYSRKKFIVYHDSRKHTSTHM